MRDVRLNGGQVEVHHIRALRDLNVKGQRRKAQVGTNHGGTETQDPRGLPDVSHGYPSRAKQSAQATVGSVTTRTTEAPAPPPSRSNTRPGHCSACLFRRTLVPCQQHPAWGRMVYASSVRASTRSLYFPGRTGCPNTLGQAHDTSNHQRNSCGHDSKRPVIPPHLRLAMVSTDRMCAMKLKAIVLGLVVALLSSFTFYWVMYYFLLVYVLPLEIPYGCDD